MSTLTDQRMIDRLPPQDTEAEEAVLGSVLMDGEALDKVRGDLTGEDFYRDRNRQVFLAMLAVANRREPCEWMTISAELKARGIYEEIGGLSYLSHLAGVVPTAVHVGHYAAIVRRTALRRRLITASGKIAALAYDETRDLDDVMTASLEELARVQLRLGGVDLFSPEDQQGILAEMIAGLEKGVPPGIPGGFYKLNKLTGGYRPGCLYVIGAPTGVGKTSWMGTEARHLRRKGHRVLFASSEMSAQELVKRNTAALMRRDWNDVEVELSPEGRVEATQQKAGQAILDLPSVAPWVYHAGSMTVDKIRRRALKVQADGGLDIVFVDYLQRLDHADSTLKNREQQVGHIAKSLKSLAGDLGVPVVVAAQFSRATQYRQDKEPLISDFRESGGIENEADVAMGLYRASKWDEKADPSEAWLFVLKNRHGREDTKFRMVWLPQVTEYVNYSAAREES